MDIEFTFINQSQARGFNVAICQKNLADGTAVAWQVIEDAAPGESYDFTYPFTTCIAVEDSWGNVSDLVETNFGQKWDVVLSAEGDDLSLDPKEVVSPEAIEIKNCFLSGSIDAGLYKDGKLLAARLGIAPSQEAVFGLDTYLWLGIVPNEIEEGDLIDPALLTTQISFMGIGKAQIVLAGGGSKPLEFFLENVQPC